MNNPPPPTTFVAGLETPRTGTVTANGALEADSGELEGVFI